MKMLKNKKALVEELAEILMRFDKELNNEYKTNVNLHYNEEKQTAELRLSQHIGSSDDCYYDDVFTIYTDEQHYDDIYDHIDFIEDAVSEALDMDIVDIKKAVSEYLECDIDDVDRDEIETWVKQFHSEQMHKYYNECFIDEERPEYLEIAYEIISGFEAEGF